MSDLESGDGVPPSEIVPTLVRRDRPGVERATGAEVWEEEKRSPRYQVLSEATDTLVDDLRMWRSGRNPDEPPLTNQAYAAGYALARSLAAVLEFPHHVAGDVGDLADMDQRTFCRHIRNALRILDLPVEGFESDLREKGILGEGIGKKVIEAEEQ